MSKAAALTKTERYRLTVSSQETDRPPIWIMRQAGRYMPEYMALRDRYSFRDLCRNPEASAAATLLPLDILDIDIMIVFNDILTPLEEMGLAVEFPNGGPQIVRPLRAEADLERFRAARFTDPEVAQALRLIKQRAGAQVPILGFAGAPFTLATYAVEGRMSKNQDGIKRLLFEQPRLLHEILGRLTETVISYLVAQVEAGGADGLQLFESHGNILTPHAYAEFAAPYQKRVIAAVKQACPEVPIHLFARGSGPLLESMAQSGADVVSIDWTVSLAEARRRVALPLQGNLDPMVLLVPEALEREVSAMIEGFDGRRGWIANLGHGITPEASVSAARQFVRLVQAMAAA